MKTKIMWLMSIILLTAMLLTSGPIFAQEGEPTLPAGDETPTETPAETPVEVPTETPVEVPTETPVEVPTETPVEIPTETPTVTPTETPVELSPLEIPMNGKVVKDRYIVVYKEGKVAFENKNAIMGFVESKGGSVKNFYRTTLNGYSAYLPQDALEAVRSDPAVDYVEADTLVTIDDEPVGTDDFAVQTTQPNATWGLDRIDQRNLPLNSQYTYFTTANDVHVYVIDTGILSSHTEFGGRASADFDSIGDGQNGIDCNGHGTHVAATIGGTTYGVAKGVRIHGVRVLGCGGSGSTSGVIAGIEWVANNRVLPAVANMSLIGSASKAMDEAVNKLISKSVTVVVAAGNEYANACNYSPARAPKAITVGATSSNDARASFSNWGSCLDLFAPGYDITSAWIGSNSATATISGTSMASPHVAGVAALFLQTNPSASPATIASLIINGSTKGVVTDTKGSQNRFLYSQSWPIPGKPVLANPASGTVTKNTTPELSWLRVNYAQNYHIQISNSSTFSTIVQQSEGIEGLSFITNVLADGIWYWRVRARNMNDDYGPWSSARYFTIDTIPPAAPILIKPLNDSINVGTPTFSWNKAAGAKYYQFAYGLSDDPGAAIHTSDWVITTSYKPPAMGALQTYYWYVRAKDAAGNIGAWSDARTITITPPKPAKVVLSAPLNASATNDTTPTFSWNAADYGVSYEIQIATNSKFNLPVLIQSGITGLNYTPTPRDDGKYYWRVRAMNAIDEYGDWSATRYLIVDTVPPATPVLASPADGKTVIGTPTFSWKAASGAKHYQFAYGLSNDPGAAVYSSTWGTKASYKPPNMEAMQTYYWFVRANDAAGNIGDWSPGRTVTVHPLKPTGVVLSAPANNYQTEDTTPAFSWNAVAYAHNYQLQVSKNTTFTQLVLDQGGITGLNFTVSTLSPGKYYWRVRAKNAIDQYGAWSAYRNLTILPSFNTQFNSPGNFEGWAPNPGAGWSVNTGSLYTNGLSNYYISSASYDNVNFKDFTYTARVKMAAPQTLTPSNWYDNVHGLVLRGTPTFNGANDWQTAYYFAIWQFNNPDWWGEAACFNVIKIVNNKWSYLQDAWYCYDFINYAGYNDLAVYMKGSTLKFYINDYLVLSKSVTGPLQGRLGVFQYGSDARRMDVDWAIAGMPVLPTLSAEVGTASAVRFISVEEMENLKSGKK